MCSGNALTAAHCRGRQHKLASSRGDWQPNRLLVKTRRGRSILPGPPNSGGGIVNRPVGRLVGGSVSPAPLDCCLGFTIRDNEKLHNLLQTPNVPLIVPIWYQLYTAVCKPNIVGSSQVDCWSNKIWEIKRPPSPVPLPPYYLWWQPLVNNVFLFN